MTVLPNHASSFPTLPLPSPFSCLSFLPFSPPLSFPLSSVLLFLSPSHLFSFHLHSLPGGLRVGAPLSKKGHLCLHRGPFHGDTNQIPGDQIQGAENAVRTRSQLQGAPEESGWGKVSRKVSQEESHCVLACNLGEGTGQQIHQLISDSTLRPFFDAQILSIPVSPSRRQYHLPAYRTQALFVSLFYSHCVPSELSCGSRLHSPAAHHSSSAPTGHLASRSACAFLASSKLQPRNKTQAPPTMASTGK